MRSSYYAMTTGLALILALSAHAQEATCSNDLVGFENAVSTVCCDVGCDVCGGAGCGSPTDPSLSASDCCTSNIAATHGLCSVKGSAPCVLDPVTAPPTTAPTETCSNDFVGFENDAGTVCCDAFCDQCGGAGCGAPTNPALFASDCCASNIAVTHGFCSVAGEAPCVLDDSDDTPSPTPAPVCPPGTSMCDDPHMQGLRGQTIDWSGVNGGWYCLVTNDNAGLHVNVRLTAPLPEAFPDRQLITGLSVVSGSHSLVIEVNNPYNVDTNGCPDGMSPCLADGGLRAFVDGEEVEELLRSSRSEYVAEGIAVSASNLPVECRQFGGDKIWARMYEEMLQGRRHLTVEERFEDWILRFDHMAAADWCTQYTAQHDLADVQSNHAVFKIVTPPVTVRLNVGTNYQGNGDLDWDGRVLPDLEFWQMDVGLHGMSTESKSLSGILGETARPVLDHEGHPVMKGYEAFRGTVEDYRVSGSLGTDFAFLNKK